jgi:hypothetical protein
VDAQTKTKFPIQSDFYRRRYGGPRSLSGNAPFGPASGIRTLSPTVRTATVDEPIDLRARRRPVDAGEHAA